MTTALNSEVGTPPSNRYSVLVVDDEPDVREQLRLRYEMEGFRVFDADGGEAALALVRSVHPDLVVTDIRMARGTGTDLLRRLHKDTPEAKPIVVCITGYADLRAHDAFDFGACAVFRKPFDMRDLMAASRRFLELREAEARAAQMMGQFEKDLRALVEITLRLGRGDASTDAPIEGLREVTAMILHEINRPLSVIAMNASLLVGALQETPPRLPAVAKMAGNVEASCQQLVQISRSMRDLFHRSKPVTDATHVAQDLIREAVRQLQASGRPPAAALRVGVPDGLCFVRGSAPQLTQALLNLLENAVQATDGLPRGEVAVLLEERGELVVFIVEDTGPGVPPEIADRVFEPFFSTKGEAGTGMGLAIAAKIAEAHKGGLTLVRRPRGARFELALPRVRSS